MTCVRFRYVAAIAASGLMLACSAVHIQTGSSSGEQPVTDNDVRAAQLQKRWHERFETMSPPQQADELKTLLDSITTSYLRLGFDMADQWQSFARQNGSSFTDEQMQAAAGDFLKSQQPFFDAYRSMAHFALGVIQGGNTLEPQTVDAFMAYVRFHDDLAALISRPSGGAAGYRRKLEDFQREQAKYSADLRAVLGR